MVKIKLDKNAYMPKREHPTDAGADIRTPKAFLVPPHGSKIVHTGVHIETPPNHVTMLKSKSGLNIKHDILTEGVIDEGFDGEIVVKVYNHGNEGISFNVGDKITQLVIMPVIYPDFEQVDEIASGERGSNGYGSTGR